MSMPQKRFGSTVSVGNYVVSGTEPTLREVLNDPCIHLLMARDGVTHGDLELLIESVRHNRRAGQSST